MAVFELTKNVHFLSTLPHHSLSSFYVYTSVTFHPAINHTHSLFRYTKPKGQLPDYSTPVVLDQNKCSVEDLCNNIHKSILKEFKQ